MGVLNKMKLVQDKIVNELEHLNDEELNQVRHVIESMKKGKEGLHYSGRFLGIDLEDNGQMTMTLGMQNANIYGVAQGGALFTFADVAIGFYIMTKIPDDKNVLTLELKMNYVKPGKGRKLYAKPNIKHLGNRTVVSECEIVDENNELVAQALGTFFLKDNRRC
jgi:uncharacterized protein (TIGR00369 family)